MPELPEVQTIADDLNDRVSGKRIVGLWYDWKKAIKFPLSVKKFKRQITGALILRVGRKGKYVKIQDTIRGFKKLMSGELDHIPEQAFYMAGTIEEVLEHAAKLETTKA